MIRLLDARARLFRVLMRVASGLISVREDHQHRPLQAAGTCCLPDACQHQHFRSVLKENGIDVLIVRDILKEVKGPEDRENLEKFAFKSMTYALEPGLKMAHLTAEEAQFVNDDYKMKNIREMSIEQLVDIILSRPLITLSKSGYNVPLTST